MLVYLWIIFFRRNSYVAFSSTSAMAAERWTSDHQWKCKMSRETRNDVFFPLSLSDVSANSTRHWQATKNLLRWQAPNAFLCLSTTTPITVVPLDISGENLFFLPEILLTLHVLSITRPRPSTLYRGFFSFFLNVVFINSPILITRWLFWTSCLKWVFVRRNEMARFLYTLLLMLVFFLEHLLQAKMIVLF